MRRASKMCGGGFPTSRKLTGLIGYRPRLSLEETLESIIADQRARLREHGVAVAAR